MVDKYSKEIRSKIMSHIRSKDTKPELLLRRELFRRGYRYRVRYRFKELNFRPDLVFISKRLAVFVDGCFWHRCPRCYREPKSNKGYWLPKIGRNVQRDREQDEYLRKNGWKVIRIWEHEIKEDLDGCVGRIIDMLAG